MEMGGEICNLGPPYPSLPKIKTSFESSSLHNAH